MIRLQHCSDCGAAQYPAREVCGACLSDRVDWATADSLPARVLARTLLHHSNELGFRARLPLWVGLVQFDAGPVAVCFLAESVEAGSTVEMRFGADELLEATPGHDG
jgi:uncharacterized OB-fold protein